MPIKGHTASIFSASAFLTCKAVSFYKAGKHGRTFSTISSINNNRQKSDRCPITAVLTSDSISLRKLQKYGNKCILA